MTCLCMLVAEYGELVPLSRLGQQHSPAGCMGPYAPMPAIEGRCGRHACPPRVVRKMICHFPLSSLFGLGVLKGVVHYPRLTHGKCRQSRDPSSFHPTAINTAATVGFPRNYVCVLHYGRQLILVDGSRPAHVPSWDWGSGPVVKERTGSVMDPEQVVGAQSCSVGGQSACTREVLVCVCVRSKWW